ncbi:MAG: SprT-like domain-containing protein [bacterium]|nr:SprT-like domain-containing protein [bacterium]
MAKIIDLQKYRKQKESSFWVENVENLIEGHLKYRCPYLIYEIVYSNSMYHNLGLCSCKTKGKYKYATFKFSRPFFEACQKTGNYDDMWDTVLHEIGHAITYYAYGAGHGHDKVWKSIMMMLGGRPEKSTNAEFFKPYRYIYKCPYCGNETKTLRKYMKGVACGKCCRNYNGGAYSTEYILDLICDEGKVVQSW